MRTPKPFGKILFKEAQSFRQARLWMILVGSFVIPLLFIAVPMVSEKQNSEKNHILIAFFAVLGTGTINIILFYIACFETIVTDEGIFYRWTPFFKNYVVIPWSEVKEMIVCKFPYLHYGYAITKRFGKAHNINGNRGVLFELLNGRKFFLGSQRIAAFHHALASVKPQLVRSEIKNID
jgi:hypothetical protein